MPEVAKGLELPDEDGVFVLDTYLGTPELVTLTPTDLSMNQKNKHGLSTLNPLAGQKANLELEGAHAKVHLHVNDPEIYLSLDSGEPAPLKTHAFTVQTEGVKEASNRKHGAHSPSSGFAIVHVDERRAVRIVGAIHVSATGTVTQDEDVIAAKTEVLAGKHWLKLTPAKPLAIGEYAPDGVGFPRGSAAGRQRGIDRADSEVGWPAEAVLFAKKERSFRHKGVEKFFLTGSKAGIQPGPAAKHADQLAALNAAAKPELMNSPGWQFHSLRGDLAGHWAVSVSETGDSPLRLMEKTRS
jgi:plasmid maintenance system killer protein